MNTIFSQRRTRLLNMKALRDNYIPAEQLVLCPSCGVESHRKEVAQGLSVCPRCGYHFPIGAYYRLKIVLDPGTFRELNEKFPAADPLSFPGYSAKLAQAQRKTGLTGSRRHGGGGHRRLPLRRRRAGQQVPHGQHGAPPWGRS